jgi:hypothetical protein
VWATWWIYLWAAVALTLIGLAFVPAVPFPWWCAATAVGFGTMEGIGVATENPYPPLTHVIRHYLPEWVAFPAIYGLTGAAGETWTTHLWHTPIPHAVTVGGIIALLGWFTTHFAATYLAADPHPTGAT